MTTTTTTTTNNNNNNNSNNNNNNSNNSNLGTAHILRKILLAKCTLKYEGLWFCSARRLRKTEDLRQQCPVVLLKTTVCVVCSVSRAHKWSWTLLFKDFQERQSKITK